MGAVSEWLLEQADADAVRDAGYCHDCGEKLSRDERESGRDECFDCYLHNQDV